MYIEIGFGKGKVSLEDIAVSTASFPVTSGIISTQFMMLSQPKLAKNVYR